MPRFLFFATVILLVPSFIFAADPIFPYGAVYFRKSNPPEQDWERDHKTAAQIGMKVVIAELVTAAPEWLFAKYPGARFQGSDRSIVDSNISGSSATGGFPGLCLDNEDVRALAEKFLTALVERYRKHPATFAYDVWNENS